MSRDVGERTYMSIAELEKMAPVREVRFQPALCWDGSGIEPRISRRVDLVTLRQQYLVNTKYKRKADKVLPVNKPDPTGAAPVGNGDWRLKVLKKYYSNQWSRVEEVKGEFQRSVIPKISGIARGSRLTPERVTRLKIGLIKPKERELLMEVLYAREAALAWSFAEIGQVREEVCPPVVIRTVPHEPWQEKGFPVPRALRPIAAKMCQERMENRVLEYAFSPYSNKWFLVPKNAGPNGERRYRLINSCTRMNGVTLKDANIPPSADDFAEEYSGMAATSVIDLFSGYDQIPLDARSRDMTAFQSPLGLVRQMTLTQGWTGAVPVFCRTADIVTTDTKDEVQLPPDPGGEPRVWKPKVPGPGGRAASPYVDDIAVKGPKTMYNEEEVMPGIRRYVYQHIRNIDRTLYNLELAGLTASGDKLMLCQPAVKVVGYVCDYNGRHPEANKVAKILDWPGCRNLTETKAFIGVVVYYRIWIKDFAKIAEPIYALQRKGAAFEWGRAQQEAMDQLKEALTTAPALRSIEYPVQLSDGTMSEVGDIIVATDASGTGWGAVLMQAEPRSKKRHPARFESGVWTGTELNYDAGKLECRGVLMALKKFRSYLYGVPFVLETDAATLVAQLNRTITDIPSAVVTRWIAWIRMFDFTVQHVSGVKNSAADGLSRKPVTPEALEEAKQEHMEEFLDRQFNLTLHVNNTSHSEDNERHAEEGGGGINWLTNEEEWSEESLQIAEWLQTLQRPKGMNASQYHRFRAKALGFMVQDGYLFKRMAANQPVRRVVDDPKRQREILHALHNDSGHRGRESTYQKVRARYWWPRVWEDVKDWCQRCDPCQRAAETRIGEEMTATQPMGLFQKWHIDTTYVSRRGSGKCALIQARESVSGWVEAEAVVEVTARTVASFVYRNIITRWGCMEVMVSDNGPEHQEVFRELMKRFKVKHVTISPYNSQANGFIEVAHRMFILGLRKLTAGFAKGWDKHLPALLWSERVTIRDGIGMSPFHYVVGFDAVLPVEVEVPTWRTLPWHKVQTRDELLALRARQIERRDEDTQEAQARIVRFREKGRELYNERTNTRLHALEKGDLVLVHNTPLNKSHSDKLGFRWLGPFRIQEALGNGSYKIEELDGTAFRYPVHGNRIKIYYKPLPLPEETSSAQSTTSVSEDEGESMGHRDDDDWRLQDLIPEGESFAVVI